MGEVISTLMYLYCRSGCHSSTVASYLAFHPPEPTYILGDNIDDDKNYTLSNISAIESVTSNTNMNTSDNKNSKQVSFIRKDSAKPDTKPDTNPDVETVEFSAHILQTSSKSKIAVLYFKRSQAKYTLLFSHGNAVDLGDMFSLLRTIALKLNVNIASYDYTGYGPIDRHNAHIRPTEKQTYRDINSVYEWLLSTGKVVDARTQLILYGQSVGSGPSIYLATKKPVAGLVIHSGILSGIRVLTPSRLLCCFDIYPNVDRIRSVTCLVFIIHGVDDLQVPIHHGTGLYNFTPTQFKVEPWWVPRRGHNDILHGNEKLFFEKIEKFLHLVSEAQDKNSPSSTTS